MDVRPNDYLIGQVNHTQAIDSLHSVAQEMGADAVINFDVQPVTKDVGTLTIPGYEANGFAIDRAE